MNQPSLSHQPLLIITAPDKPLTTQSLPIINQSLPHQSQPITSYTLSPIITDALKINPAHQFAFTATNGLTPKQSINPLAKSAKENLTRKITRTGATRTGPKHDPHKHPSDPTQNLAAGMEIQTEKKRRRENEQVKEDDSTIVQHFLTAGPGSQDCRDQ
ncbi:hypothetical protein P8452_25829 [Trifolium repens]|nr:hypothetical protein P8452_25829 [Trifolium repens]